MANEESLAFQILKARYFPNGSLFEAGLGHGLVLHGIVFGELNGIGRGAADDVWVMDIH